MPLLSGIKTDEQELSELRQMTAEGGFIGLAQINSGAGDLKGNALKIAKCIKYAESVNLDMVVFSEMALTGGPIYDTIKRHPFLADESLKWLKELARLTDKTAALVGFAEPADDKNGNRYYNSVAILKNGNIEKIVRKSASLQEVYNINGAKYCITIGDNFIQNSVSELKKAGAEVIINCSSSPAKLKKEELKQQLLSFTANSQNLPIVYVNQVGATDNISFDGASRAVAKDGRVIAKAKSFDEDFIIVNPLKEIGDSESLSEPDKQADNRKEFTLDYEPELEFTYKTIVQGIKDYFSKCGLKRAVLGLSGGLDSSVCAVLLADALGKENVFGISMPSKLTSKESKSDAQMLASNLGINFAELSIKPVVDTTTDCLNGLFKAAEEKWQDRYENSFTPDNIQARARAVYLWGMSNEFPSCIPIATSDKSEAYMGYATINGDMSGGFAPIADVTKTKLFALARWMNLHRASKNAIPKSVILKKPGAELAINPKTGKTLNAEDALMPYEFLDEIIWRIENKNESYKDLINAKFIYEEEYGISRQQKVEWLNKFYDRMSKALYKWSIMPPSVIINKHSINRTEYVQPITSCKINYKGHSMSVIRQILSQAGQHKAN